MNKIIASFPGRQGDCPIVEVKDWQKGTIVAKPENGRLIIARGEATGHHHSVEAGKAELCFFETDKRPSILEGLVLASLEVKEVTEIIHVGHHNPIPIAPGLYFVLGQREYRRGEIQRVMD